MIRCRGPGSLSSLSRRTLAGRSDRIKGTTIALEVYGRGANFDPQSDPIVRVEALKMRRDLEHYYLTAGIDEGIRIEVPKGGYVPVITRVDCVASAEPAAPVLAEVGGIANGPSVDHEQGPPIGTGWLRFWPALAGFAALMVALIFALTRIGPDVSGDGPVQVSGPTLFVTPFQAASSAQEEIALAPWCDDRNNQYADTFR